MAGSLKKKPKKNRNKSIKVGTSWDMKGLSLEKKKKPSFVPPTKPFVKATPIPNYVLPKGKKKVIII